MSDKIIIENAKVTDKGVEFKQSNTGKDYAEFTVMWSSARKNRQTDQMEYGPTKFLRVRVFGFKAGDIVAGVNAGDRVNVTGNLEHFTWESNNGPKDDWNLFAESVSLPVPRAQQQGGGNFGGQQQGGFSQQQQGGFGQQQADPWGGAPTNQSDNAPF